MTLQLSKQKKHWLMAGGFGVIAVIEGSFTSIAAAAINLIWLLEE